MQKNANNKKVLIPQARLATAHAPYIALADKHGLQLDFHPFTSTAPVADSEFRKYTQDINHRRAGILFTNKTAMKHFFDLAKKINITKLKLSEETRYFCATEQLKHYLQIYINMRQRKVLHGTKSLEDIYPKIKKLKDLNFLLPSSNVKRKSLASFFKTNGLSYKEVPTYRTIFNDLTNLQENAYDLVLFFSPLEVKALSENGAKLITPKTKIAVFGSATQEAVKKAGWEPSVKAPNGQDLSLASALDRHFAVAG